METRESGCRPGSLARNKQTSKQSLVSGPKKNKTKPFLVEQQRKLPCVGLCPPLVSILHICPQELSLLLSRKRYKRAIPLLKPWAQPSVPQKEGERKRMMDGKGGDSVDQAYEEES